MKRILLLCISVIVSAGFSRSQGGAMTTSELKPGDAAPPFAMTGSDGKVHKLADEMGKRAVVLAWFPKAFTGG